MKTVKEAKKSTTKVVKKTVKPVFTVKIEPDMTIDELHRAFIEARVEKKLPITKQDIDFVDAVAYNDGVQDGIKVGKILKEFAIVLNQIAECKNEMATSAFENAAKTHAEPEQKKTPWYKKLWHFVTFRGWK